MRTFKATLLFLFYFAYCQGQEYVARESFLSPGFIQIKESANVGLVFKGPSVNYGMLWCLSNEKRMITFEPELGLSILFSRDIPALGFYLKPVDFAYLFKFTIKDDPLYVGPSFNLEYSYNLYPDLQSGFDYWFTNTGFGIHAIYDLRLNSSAFVIKLASSFAGFTSRQQNYRDPYFYDMGMKHAFSHLHQDLTFGSFNRYSCADLEILWKPKPDSRLSIGYELKYSGYFQAPEISVVNHNIKLIFNKKQKDEKK